MRMYYTVYVSIWFRAPSLVISVVCYARFLCTTTSFVLALLSIGFTCTMLVLPSPISFTVRSPNPAKRK